MYGSYYSSSVPSTKAVAATSATSANFDQIFAAIMGIGIFFWIVALGLAILILVARWQLFKKANVDPWEALIPVHSDIVELKLGGMQTPWWFLNLIAICGIGPIAFGFIKNIALAKAFGKGAGFGVLLTFFPFVCYPILAFGNAQYVGPQNNNM